MSSINDLPVELLINIFKLIYDDYTQMNSLEDDFVVEGGYSDPFHPSIWIEDDLQHTLTLFPMTIAFVCHHWRDILAQSPEYWDRVVFEVGRDPTPLLDAFSWSKSQLLDVLIWSRTPDLTTAGKTLENERVSAITKSLAPHFHRCCRIRYKVTYASSLPPIETIFRTRPSVLKRFVFEPYVDDVQYNPITLVSMVANYRNPAVLPFSILSTLSLGARFFIDLGRAYPAWLHNLQSGVYLTLIISQFRFQQKKYGDDERYTLSELLYHLAAIPQPKVLRLRNLSLSFEPGIFTRDPYYSVMPGSLFLDHLGEDFLSEFFERTHVICNSIFINRCTIPWMNCALNSSYLHLDHMGYIHNIANILCVWQGSHLSLNSCASFDDDLLDRLEDEGRNWCHLKLISDLILKDCINFSSAGLRKLMTLQRTMAAAEDVGHVFDRIYVEGGRLTLWEDDISWFRHQRGSTDVSWTIVHPDGTYTYPLINHYLED